MAITMGRIRCRDQVREPLGSAHDLAPDEGPDTRISLEVPVVDPDDLPEPEGGVARIPGHPPPLELLEDGGNLRSSRAVNMASLLSKW